MEICTHVIPRLFICQNVVMARTLALTLHGTVNPRGGWLSAGEDAFAYCIGPIVQYREPEEMAVRANVQGVLEPVEWETDLTANGRDLIGTLDALAAEAAQLIHAGYPNAQGQWLIDAVLGGLHYSLPVQRACFRSLDRDGVRDALDNLASNEEYRGLSERGRAHERATWLVKANLRNAPWAAQDDVDIRELVVLRAVREQIDHAHAQGDRVFARMVQGDLSFRAEMSGLNGNADAIVSSLVGQQARVLECQTTTRQAAAPAPYDALSLAADAFAKLGLGYGEAMGTLLDLYDKGAISFPLGTCSQYGESPADFSPLLEELAMAFPDLAQYAYAGCAWPQARCAVTTRDHHHAFLPTPICCDLELSDEAYGMLELIARRVALGHVDSARLSERRMALQANGSMLQAYSSSAVMDDERFEEVPAQHAIPELTTGQMVTVADAYVRAAADGVDQNTVGEAVARRLGCTRSDAWWTLGTINDLVDRGLLARSDGMLSLREPGAKLEGAPPASLSDGRWAKALCMPPAEGAQNVIRECLEGLADFAHWHGLEAKASR